MRCLVVSWHSTAGHASTTNQSMGAQVPLHSLGCTTLSLTHILTHSLTAYKEWKDGGGGEGWKGSLTPTPRPLHFHYDDDGRIVAAAAAVVTLALDGNSHVHILAHTHMHACMSTRGEG